MHRWSKRIGLAVLASSFTLGPALADRVVGPFRCQIEAGRLKVESGPVKMFRVIGQHDERPYSFCEAGGEDERCRTLVLHRFDVECGAAVVPWQVISAYLLARRASDVDASSGQLSFRLREPSFASLNPLCPSATAEQVELTDAARHWRLDSTCREFGFVPRNRIQLPAGYALLSEFGGRVIAGHSDVAAVTPPAPARKPSRPVPVLTAAPAPVERVAVVQVPRPEVVSSQLEQPAPRATETVRATPVALGVGTWNTLVEVVRAGTGEAVGREVRRNAQQSMVATLLGLTLLTSLFSGISWLAGRQLWRQPDPRKVDPYQVMLRREVVDLAKPDAQMCGELCRSAQGLVGQIHGGVSELKGVAPLRRVLLREVRNMERFLAATIATEPTDPQEWRRMRLRLQRVVTDLMRLKDITDGARKSLTTAVVTKDLPRDKYEAYEVLGANPEASEKIIKRLVDALRATWHPDHAHTEEDRQVREERIKQINVAWDLILDKRVEV